jgi:Ca-activated chloride channel family protein
VIEETYTVELPVEDTRYPEVRRRWARARVDYLLDLINSEGENEEWIAEIVSLSKEFNFVTPYTSFLAAPRSLIRPRSIRPGDPVLRVRTDPAIVRVTAFFPFGLVRSLDWLNDQEIWETRFLAPVEMRDGEYWCTLALEDAEGNVFEEKKSFIIDSRPPRLIPEPIEGEVQPGDEITLRVAADRDTRWIRASLDGLPFVELKWDSEELTNVGKLRIPPEAALGLHEIKLTARDFAHNNSALSIKLDIGGAS